MSEIWDWIAANREWVFSGIGVVVLGWYIRLFLSRRKAPGGDVIVTHGNQSPGKVEGNYAVETHERTEIQD